MSFCLETVGLRVPGRYIRDVSMFSVSTSSRNGPSARCASAACFCILFVCIWFYFTRAHFVIGLWVVMLHQSKY
jgi:hypothetical protein